MTNNELQDITLKITDRATRTPLKTKDRATRTPLKTKDRATRTPLKTRLKDMEKIEKAYKMGCHKIRTWNTSSVIHNHRRISERVPDDDYYIS